MTRSSSEKVFGFIEPDNDIFGNVTGLVVGVNAIDKGRFVEYEVEAD